MSATRFICAQVWSIDEHLGRDSGSIRGGGFSRQNSVAGLLALFLCYKASVQGRGRLAGLSSLCRGQPGFSQTPPEIPFWNEVGTIGVVSLSCSKLLQIQGVIENIKL